MFIYSEKATKFCEIFPLLLTSVNTVKSKGKILQNFVAFSEYMNFMQLLNTLSCCQWKTVLWLCLRRHQDKAIKSIGIAQQYVFGIVYSLYLEGHVQKEVFYFLINPLAMTQEFQKLPMPKGRENGRWSITSTTLVYLLQTSFFLEYLCGNSRQKI